MSVLLIEPLFKIGKNYYQQVFLEQCRYVIKEYKMTKFIKDELEISSDDSDYSEESDKEKCKDLIINQ